MYHQNLTNMDTLQELTTFDSRWNMALENNNATEIGAFMADDWIIVGTEGGITTKAEFLSRVSSGDLMHTRMDADERRVKIYGNTGVITGRGTSSGTWQGMPFSLYEWSTSVYIRDAAGWKCVLSMLTPADKA